MNTALLIYCVTYNYDCPIVFKNLTNSTNIILRNMVYPTSVD